MGKIGGAFLRGERAKLEGRQFCLATELQRMGEKRSTSMHEFQNYKVRDFMSRSGIFVGKHATLAEAEAFFEMHDFNVLPVVEGLRLVGMLTKSDLLKAYGFEEGGPIPSLSAITRHEVHEFMNVHPDTVSPETPISHVLERMVETRQRSFPVVEDEQLVGMISREDVVRALRCAQRRAAPGQGGISRAS